MPSSRPAVRQDLWLAATRMAAGKLVPYGPVAVSRVRIIASAHSVSIQSLLAALKARKIDRVTFDNEMALERAAMRAELDASLLSVRASKVALRVLFALVRAAARTPRAGSK